MILKVQHPELLENLQKKNKLVDEGRALTKQIDDLETERNKIGAQIQKLKDKIIPVSEELVKPALGEFDMLTTINIERLENGEFTDNILLEYIDQVEDFKNALREKMAEGKNVGEVAKEVVQEVEDEQNKKVLDSTDNSNAGNENTIN